MSDLRNDTMVLEIGTALVQVTKKAVDKLRPLIWRQFITPNTSVNPAVEYIEMQKRVDFAEIRPIGPQDQQFPLVTEEKTSRRITVYEFGSGVRIHQDELDRAALTGDSPATTRVAAIFRKAEETLDRIAAIGYSDLGLRGILNQADVTPVASVAGGWLAASPNAANMLADMNAVVDAVATQSSEVVTANELILPPTGYRVAARTIFQSNSPDSVLQVFQRQNPGVRVTQWSHAATAGAGGALGRMAAFRSGDTDILDMHVLRFLTADEPIRIVRGYETAFFMKCGGVDSLFPQGIAYGDDILALS